MLRQEHELADNKRVLEKQARVDTLLENCKGDGISSEEDLAYVSNFFQYLNTNSTKVWKLFSI